MIKKLFHVLTLVLALNFLAALGGVGFLVGTGKLDKEKAAAVRELLFPHPAAGPEIVATTQPTTKPTNGPSKQLEDLLAKHAGRPVDEQVEAVRQSIDAQAADLDRRQREMEDLRAQLLREKAELARKTTELADERARLAADEKAQAAMAGDKGFKDSLALYEGMPAKNAKQAFMTMPEADVARYLQAMNLRTATKIFREFKTPDEQARINRVMERVRSGSPGAMPTTTPSGVAAGVP